MSNDNVVPIQRGMMIYARYANMKYRVAQVVGFQDVQSRPFGTTKTLVTIEYLADGMTAEFDLSGLRSNWLAGTKRLGKVVR